MADFKQQFADFRIAFEPKIIQYLDSQIKRADEINPAAAHNMRDILRLVHSGGKRIRPALAYFGYLASGGPVNESIYQLGIALEVFHTAALIHDDIADKSLIRRGHPTMEATYRDEFSSKGMNEENSKHFAMVGALYGGVMGTVLANEIVANIDCDSYQLRRKVQFAFHKMQFEGIAGQIDDCIGVGIEQWDKLEEERIINMLKCKSGHYTIQKPTIMGMVLADASEEIKQVLFEVGDNLSLLFQLTDDIIGLYGDEAETGKSNTSDVTEGKRTLLMFRAYQRATQSEKMLMGHILGNAYAKPEEIQWVKEFIINSGVLDDVKNLCNQLNDRAQDLLAKNFAAENEGAQFISGLGNYLLNRKS